MLDFPKPLHQLHIFEKDDGLYAADLDKARLVEISTVIVDILKLSETRTTDAITATLKTAYSDEDIEEAFETLTGYAKQGLLFTRGGKAPMLFPKKDEDANPHLLLVLPGFNPDTFTDIENTSAGTNIALVYTIQALKKYAVLYFAGTQNRKLDENFYEVDLNLGDIIRVPEKIAERYDGILTLHWELDGESVLPLFRCPELPPILMQIHAVRGHGGTGVRSVLLHYAALRDYDTFTAPSDSVGEFYSRFVWDKGVFHTVPNGVDQSLFRPMDKQQAKQEVAELVGDNRIKAMPTVGYLSRLQAEKGASIYLQLAELNPHILFLQAGWNEGRYAHRTMPENLVYVGFHPREKLPLIYNAFDVYCFPSVSGEETFGLTVLEAMACGVPPVVPDFNGVPSVVGDAGLIVPVVRFEQDITTITSYASPLDFSEKVNLLLNDDKLRHGYSRKALSRAQTFTWENAAQRILSRFEYLSRKKKLRCQNRLLPFFSPYWNGHQKQMGQKSVILNMNTLYEKPVNPLNVYNQPVEDGLVLSLLKEHTSREVEAILCELMDDENVAKAILAKCHGFIQATA
ncbi:MAG: glycosyltransferase family 4 protein [Candidatus Poribacteria bacterium]|nr:glycosyltransferase family 4 protein [Candidatus Poribacteria bacterium]